MDISNKMGEFCAFQVLLSFIVLIISLIVSTNVVSSNETVIYYRPLEITKDADTFSSVIKYVEYSKPRSEIDVENLSAEDFNQEIKFIVTESKEIYLSPISNVLVKMSFGENIYRKTICSTPYIGVYLEEIKINEM